MVTARLHGEEREGGGASASDQRCRQPAETPPATAARACSRQGRPGVPACPSPPRQGESADGPRRSPQRSGSTMIAPSGHSIAHPQAGPQRACKDLLGRGGRSVRNPDCAHRRGRARIEGIEDRRGRARGRPARPFHGRDRGPRAGIRPTAQGTAGRPRRARRALHAFTACIRTAGRPCTPGSPCRTHARTAVARGTAAGCLCCWLTLKNLPCPPVPMLAIRLRCCRARIGGGLPVLLVDGAAGADADAVLAGRGARHLRRRSQRARWTETPQRCCVDKQHAVLCMAFYQQPLQRGDRDPAEGGLQARGAVSEAEQTSAVGTLRSECSRGHRWGVGGSQGGA